MQLFSEQEYETAKFCFQRAGETFSEQWAEAAGLRSAAWSTSSSNFDVAEMFLKKAAKIFNSIGKLEEAAQCFYESKEYEMAGISFLSPKKTRKKKRKNYMYFCDQLFLSTKMKFDRSCYSVCNVLYSL